MAAKTHAGATCGIDHNLYARREAKALKSVSGRLGALLAAKKALLK